MKTVMKKLLSLMLVAILLVSAVPFQAAATDIDDEDDGDDGVKQVTLTINYDTGIKTGSATITVDEDSVIERSEVFAKLTEKVGTVKSFRVQPNPIEWPIEMDSDKTINVKVVVPHTCDYQINTEDATCTESGKITKTCKICGNVETETIDPKGHSWGEWTTTKAATPTEGGQEKRVCSVCEREQFRDTQPTGEDTYTVKFYAGDELVASENWALKQTVPTLPSAPKKSGYQFKGWYTGKNANGEKLEKGDKWDGTTIYYAYYTEDSTGTKDGMSKLTVRMRLYTGSTLTNDVILFTQELEDDTYILSWLQNNTSTVREAVYSKVDDTEYEWIDRVFYDNDSKAELTSQATLADGDKVVFVKVHALDSKETNVQLYIHKYNSTSKTYSTLKIVDVSGYKNGDTITLSKMATIVKKSYSYTSIKGLYTANAWSQLVNGQNPTASTSLTVNGDGTVKYHVVLNGATAASGSTSNADKTNPKTGDMIFVPVMVMVASAAAVAFVYFGSKKRFVR